MVYLIENYRHKGKYFGVKWHKNLMLRLARFDRFIPSPDRRGILLGWLGSSTKQIQTESRISSKKKTFSIVEKVYYFC
jgi:hypothetical protein